MNRKRKLKIDKRGAAKRQIETAIQAWFRNGDPVSIHTLAVAAGEILHALGRSKGRPSRFQTYLASLPKSMQKRMRGPQNFFKHGFRDTGEAIPYYPIYGEMLLFDATDLYGDLFGSTPTMMSFNLRHVSEHPIFYPSWAARMREAGLRRQQLVSLSRQEFFDDFLPLFKRKRQRAFWTQTLQLS